MTRSSSQTVFGGFRASGLGFRGSDLGFRGSGLGCLKMVLRCDRMSRVKVLER